MSLRFACVDCGNMTRADVLCGTCRNPGCRKCGACCALASISEAGRDD